MGTAEVAVSPAELVVVRTELTAVDRPELEGAGIVVVMTWSPEVMVETIPPATPEPVVDGWGVDRMVVVPIVLVMTESPEVITDTISEVAIGTALAVSEPVA